MIRCTIELLPFGSEERKRTIGLVEIANDGTGTSEIGNYVVSLKKTPPFSGCLRSNWRRGRFDDAEIIQDVVEGHHRSKRGVYDLLYRALKSCGLDERLPDDVARTAVERAVKEALGWPK